MGGMIIKLWIINILQYIINSIESEEDKTLPEDYFKDIIIKLQQLPKRKMTEGKKQEVWKLYQIRRAFKTEFPQEVELKLVNK